MRKYDLAALPDGGRVYAPHTQWKTSEEVEPRDPVWLFEEPPIPLHGITLVSGFRAATKTTFACWLTAQATSKGHTVFLCSQEDDLRSFIRPRIEAAGADLSMREVAPWGLRELADKEEFTERYVARLNRLGIDLLLQRFAEVSTAHDGRGLVFLCFEPVGAFCHRGVLARLIEELTGQRVPELRDP